MPQPTAVQTTSATGAEPSSATSTSAEDDDDSWKEAYQTQIRSWRAQSAEQREKAEKERLRWETIRAQEKEEADQRKSASVPSVQESWEQLGPSGSSVTATIASHPMQDEHVRNLSTCSSKIVWLILIIASSVPRRTLRLWKKLLTIFKGGKLCLLWLLSHPSYLIPRRPPSLPDNPNNRQLQSPFRSLILLCLHVHGYWRSRPLSP